MAGSHDKPRYRGILSGGRIKLVPVSEEVGAERHEKPRYKAVLEGERVSGFVELPRDNQPGAVETPIAETLRELGDQQRGGPVPITYYPTRTSNPADPRTAAAGYDRQTRTLRVEWGDGGPAYNYYEVEPDIWQRFKKSASPGRFINRVLNSYPYGPA